MEAGVCGDEFFVVMEEVASLANDVVEIVDGCEMLVDDWLVDERPEAFGGLQLGTVGWQIGERDAGGDGEVFRRVPTGIVELEEDDAITPGAGCLREGCEQLGEERLVDAVRHYQTVSPVAGATKAMT